MDDYSRIVIRNMVDDGSKIWFCNLLINALYCMDKETCTIHFVSFLPCFQDGFLEYGPINYVNGQVYIAPLGAKSVLIYNTLSNEIESINLDEKYMPDDFSKGNLFFDIISYSNYVYLIPGRYKAIIRIEVARKSIKYIEFYDETFRNEVSDDKRILFSFRNAIWSDRLYLPLWQSNKVMVLGLKNNDISYICVNDKECKFSAIEINKSENNMFLADRDESLIIKANFEGEILDRYNINKLEKNTKLRGIQNIKLSEGFLYAIPFQGDRMIRINYQTGDQEVINELSDYVGSTLERYIIERINYLYELDSDEEMFLYSSLDGRIIKAIIKGSEFYVENVIEARIINEDEVRTIKNKYCTKPHWKWNGIIYEEDTFKLYDYISSIID